MNLELHRHDLTDRQWELLEPHLSGRPGQWGRVAHDNRRFINGVMWILRTGSPWRDLPSEYGGWSNTHRRFTRWRDNGTWEKLLGVFIDEPDLEWRFIDATHCKAHQGASGARGGNEGIGLTKGGETPKYIWPWMRMVCRCELLSQKLPERIAALQKS